MRTNKGFNLRTVCGEKILVAEGKQYIDFNFIVSLNESAAYLWEALQDKTFFTPIDMAHLLTAKYEIEATTALKDAEALAKQWQEIGIITE